MSDEQILIKELTEAQIAKFDDYRDRYIDFGYSSRPADREAAEKCIDEVYAAGVPDPFPPPKKVWVESPMAGALMAFDIMAKDGDASLKVDTILECGFGQHDVSWLAFYSFFSNECDLASAKPAMPLAKLSEYCGWWWPFDELCILSERPSVLKINDRSQLHCDGGPSLLYPDGFSLFTLNGVCVPENIVMTPAEELDPKLIFSETNAEIRREILRKMGIDRFIQYCNPKVLDAKGDYELLEINDIERFPRMVYLKMINPSIGTYHVEGVADHCKTVQEAINWRAGDSVDENENWEPSHLS